MKQRIIALACVIAMTLLTVTTQAQLLNVARTADSSVVIDKLYAGMLANTSYLLDKDTTTVSTAFRVGVAAHWDIGKKLTIKSFTAGEHDFIAGSSFGLHALWMQYRPTAHWAIEAGRGPTVAAQQHRPHPVSQSGQFETWTEAQLPGIAYTVNLKYIPNANSLIAGGFSLRDNMPEYQITGTVKRISLTGYYQSVSNTACAAITYNGKRFYNTSFVKSDGIGTFSSLAINHDQTLYLFTDFGYNTKTNSIVRWGTGIFSSYKMGYMKAVFALSYNHEIKGITGYLFVSL